MAVAALLGVVACSADHASEQANARVQQGVDQNPSLVIRQVYKGGEPPAAYAHDFVEIFNRGTAPASLSGVTLQIWVSSSSYHIWWLPALSLAPGQSYLIRGPMVAANAPPLPIYDADASGGILPTNLFSPAIALVRSVLDCGNENPPCSSAASQSQIIDGVSFGSIFALEGTKLAALVPGSSYERKNNGTTDTNNNAADFALNSNPVPRASTSYIPPPDTTVGAPAVNLSEVTSPGESWEFLYTGTNPIQTGVSETAIEGARAGLVTGNVTDSNGVPIVGVKATIADAPQYGETLTRANGRYDLVVNGGGHYTVRLEKVGYLPVDRLVQVDWETTATVPPVVMLQRNTVSTPVAFGSGAIATGTASTDANGTRSGQLMIPPGTTATANGQPLNSMTFRMTEYTVGPKGPAAMPAPIPPGVGYTYAVELSADEALTSGVTFSQPLPFYLHNFLNFDVGEPVPTGYYDRVKKAWIPSTAGRVIKILSRNGGTVQLELVKNAGAAAESAIVAAGITSSERAQLFDDSTRYAVGSTWWRVPIPHFSTWDCNWPFGPPPCEGAICPGPTGDAPEPPDDQCQSTASGSIIHCESQGLGERIPVPGTPFSLHYSSRRMPGYQVDRQLRIKLTGAEQLHSKLRRIDLRVSVAGRSFSQSFAPAQNLSTVFTWDGNDGFGRPVVGEVSAVIEIVAAYWGDYAPSGGAFGTPSSAAPGSFAGDRARGEILFPQRFTRRLRGRAPTASWLLGGVSLSVHHSYAGVGSQNSYSGSSGLLYLGTGEIQRAAAVTGVVEHVAGNGVSSQFPADGTKATLGGFDMGLDVFVNRFAVAPNGDMYVAGDERIRRIDGKTTTIHTVAGANGNKPCSFPDGAPALSPIHNANGLAVGTDGTLYFAGGQSQRIHRIKNGLMYTVAGSATCVPGSSYPEEGDAGDGGPALQARFNSPSLLTLAPDGSLFVLDSGNFRIRKIDPSGIINTVAGNGTDAPFSPSAFGQRALTHPLGLIEHIAAAPDGSLYIKTYHFISRLDPDGILRPVSEPTGNAQAAAINKVDDGVTIGTETVEDQTKIAVGSDGTLFFEDNDWSRQQAYRFTPSSGTKFFRAVNRSGIVTTFARNSASSFLPPDGSLALGELPTDGTPEWHNASNIAILAAAPDGSVLVGSSYMVFRIRGALANTAAGDRLVPSPSGDEVYRFDPSGRHLATQDARTGATLYTFAYDGAWLSSITEVNGTPGGSNKVTTITRPTGSGQFVIQSPFGQTLTIHALNGYASWISDGDQVDVYPTIDANGLLTSMIDLRGENHSFRYDSAGRLIRDTDPAMRYQTLDRWDLPDGYRVERRTSLQRSTKYQLTRSAAGVTTSTITAPSGLAEVRTKQRDLSTSFQYPDGTVVTRRFDVDARLGSRFKSAESTMLPSTLTRSLSRTVATVPETPTDPFGITSETTTTVINGRPWLSTYTAQDRKTIVTSPLGRTTTRMLDAQGRLSMTALGGLEPITFHYDELGRLEQILQGTRSSIHDYETSGVGTGYLSAVTRSIDAASADVTSFARDSLGRATSETVDTATTFFTWDPAGNLTTVTPPGKPIHQQSYNVRALLDTYTPPAAGLPRYQTKYTYDGDRALDLETRPHETITAGVVIDRNYDSAGRIDTVSAPGVSLDYNYYTAADTGPGKAPGNVSTLTGPYGITLAFEYDGKLPTKTTWSGTSAAWGGTAVTPVSVARQYNADFKPSRETVTGGVVSGVTLSSYAEFGYDADGLLTCAAPNTSCALAGNAALRLTRNCASGPPCSPQNGLVTQITLGNTTEDLTYNQYGELVRQVAKYGSTTLLDISYDVVSSNPSDPAARDNLSRIRRKNESIRGVTPRQYDYTYDPQRRLTLVKRDGIDYEDFDYDGNGNKTRWSPTPHGSPVTSATYDDQDRMRAFGTMTFEYGANGELKKKTVSASNIRNYTYDALGNLTKVTSGTGATVAEYGVDGLGRRVWRKAGSSVKRWLYRDGLNPVAELDGNGALVAQFVYGSKPNVPDYIIRQAGAGTTKTYRVISDHLGSPRYVVNVSDINDVPFRAEYTAFGFPIGSNNIGLGWMPFGFAGGIYDADTDLIRFGARDYDPVRGRWIAKDPIRFDGEQSNLYVYSGNDPVNRRDPSGLEPVELCDFVSEVMTMLVCPRFCGVAINKCNLFCGVVGGNVVENWCDPEPPKAPPPPPVCPPGEMPGGEWLSPSCIWDPDYPHPNECGGGSSYDPEYADVYR